MKKTKKTFIGLVAAVILSTAVLVPTNVSAELSYIGWARDTIYAWESGSPNVVYWFLMDSHYGRALNFDALTGAFHRANILCGWAVYQSNGIHDEVAGRVAVTPYCGSGPWAVSVESNWGQFL